MSDFEDFGGDEDFNWEEVSWAEAEGLAGLGSGELVELLDSFEFASGQFEFNIEMDDGNVISISVDVDDMYDLYEWLEDEGYDFYVGYEEH